jgi:hypothetical protein
MRHGASWPGRQGLLGEPTEREAMTIELKCWPDSFDATVAGLKTAEVRSTADRQFVVGDILKLRRWDPIAGAYTGQEALAQVRHLATAAGSLQLYGVGDSAFSPLPVVVLSFRLIESSDQHGAVSHV